MVIGIASTLVSVPLFFAAGSNNRKARIQLDKIQNSVGNIKFDNAQRLGVSFVIPLN